MLSYDFRTRRAIDELEALTRRYQAVEEGSRKASFSPPRHKVFISYHAADAVEVLDFIRAHTDVFIPRAIGLEEDGSDIINSTDVDYIRGRIRSKFLKDSTVTLVALGRCTWARKYVDWEIYSSLRSDPNPNGLLGIQLPSVSGKRINVPDRLLKNLSSSEQGGYAGYYRYPSSETILREWIEKAFQKRTTQADQIELGGSLRERNASCH